MKRAFFLVGTGLVFGMGMVSACGGTETTPAVIDSGTETGAADTSVAADTGRDAKPLDGATCDLSSDFTKSQLPDASLTDGGDGGIDPAVCVGCIDKSCKAEKEACNANCECKGVVLDVIKCLGNGTDILTCAGTVGVGLSAEGQAVGGALLSCVNSKCKGECIPANLQDASLPKDGGGG